MKISRYNSLVPRSDLYKVTINDLEVDVLHACTADFSTVYYEENMEIKVFVKDKINPDSTFVKPLSKNIEYSTEGNVLTIKATKKCDLALYINDEFFPMPLFIFMNDEYNMIEEYKKQLSEDCIVFSEGQVYDIEQLVLKSGQVVYIEQGAFVRGAFYAQDAENVRIIGNGVLDGSFFQRPNNAKKSVLCEGCKKIEVRDITIINPSAWITVIVDSDDVRIEGVREIAEYCGTDGFDICSSTNVTIRGCFVCNNDDCVVIKAIPISEGRRFDSDTKLKCPENIVCEDCTFINGPAGNAIEVGHELRTDYVRNVVFKNIDILSVHGHGAALSIHAGDRALIDNIVFDNIRIYHCYDKVIDFRVMKSQFNWDDERGYIRNVLIKDVNLKYSNSNPGYTVSTIGGYDAEHNVDGVIFDNFRVNGEKVMNLDTIDILTRHASNISFR